MPYATGCRGCGTECDGVRCDDCREQRRKEEAERRAERIAAGLCIVCAGPVSKTKMVGGELTGGVKRVRVPARYCKTHLEYYAARQRERA